jgi:hypothetical protein
MSKSISQIKSLHDHVITVILTPADGECKLWEHSLLNSNDKHGLVQPELCFGFAKHQFFIR